MANRNHTPDQDPAAGPMFGTLLASRPKRNLRTSITSTVGSVIVHALVICGLVVATMKAAQKPADTQDIRLTSLAPPAPAPLPPPEASAATAAAAASEVPRGFATLPTADFVPNVIPLETMGSALRAEDFEPVGVAGGRPDGTGKGEPTNDQITRAIVPMDVAPRLKNQGEIEKAVARNYPSALKDAGIGGTTNLWIRVDEEGNAVAWDVKKGSGFDALDSAAVRVAPSLKFKPAMVGDRTIPVWISIDIVFSIR